MSELQSTVIALNGPAKCGKTTYEEFLLEAAQAQDGAIPDMLAVENEWSERVRATPELQTSLEAVNGAWGFNAIESYSNGNVFRAAAHLLIEEESLGGSRKAFDERDAEAIARIFVDPSLRERLQTHPDVANRVSTMATTMVGVQAVCNAIFCDAVQRAYNYEGGGNLVIIDARDPVGILGRHGLLGYGPGQIIPASILPAHIDNSPEVAGKRMKSDMSEQDRIEYVSRRREQDMENPELKYRPPLEADCDSDLETWMEQFNRLVKDPDGNGEVARHLWIDNGEGMTLANARSICGAIAIFAQNVAIALPVARRLETVRA
jgi:hypothetical protein